MTLALTTVSETASTVTFGWTPPAGVQWYTFYTEGIRVSNAPPVDKSGTVKSTIRFAGGKNQYQVVAICLNEGVFSLEVGTWDKVVVPPPPPPPPPPPVTNPPFWVANFENLTATNWWAQFSQNIEAHNYAYPNDTAAKVFGNAFLETGNPLNGAGSCRMETRYNATSTNQYVMLANNTVGRVEGQDDYYTMSYRFDGANFPAGSVTLNEIFFQGKGGGGPTFGLTKRTSSGGTVHSVDITLASGVIAAAQPFYQFNNSPGGNLALAQPVPPSRFAFDVVHEFVIHIRWSAFAAAGIIEVWHRRKGIDTGWTKTVDMQPGVAATAQCDANHNIYFAGAPNVQDHFGLYRAPKVQAMTRLELDDLTRSHALADAFAYLDASPGHRGAAA